MIVNACVKENKMVDENVCKKCMNKNCRHAGQPTTAERLDMGTYGTKEYWEGKEERISADESTANYI